MANYQVLQWVYFKWSPVVGIRTGASAVGGVPTNYEKKIMDISVISIGNSKGIRLSKTLLKKYNIHDTVELILEKSYIILKPKSYPRKGWEKAFKKIHESGDDKLLMTAIFMDKDMLLKDPKNKNQVNDWNTWCPGDTIGSVIDSPLNPVLF